MPGIIRCPNGHTLATPAKIGGTTSCPACRAEGRGRVSVRVHRADTAGGQSASPAAAESAELETAWAAEEPEAGWQDALGAPGGSRCPQCNEPMRWTGADTAVICPADGYWSVSPKLLGRVAERAEQTAALERRRSSRELAVVDEAQARTERVQFTAHVELVGQIAAQMADDCNPDRFERGADCQAAAELGAVLRAWQLEIRSAQTGAELDDIVRELLAIRESPRYAELCRVAELVAEQRHQRAEVIEWRRQAAAEAGRQQRQAIASAERQQRQAEQAAAAEARRKPATTTRTPMPSGYAMAAYSLMQMVERRAEAREARLQRCGACGFRHPLAVDGAVPADRIYGLMTIAGGFYAGDRVAAGQLDPGRPSIRACTKHFAAAEQWMTEQGCPSSYYWELS